MFLFLSVSVSLSLCRALSLSLGLSVYVSVLALYDGVLKSLCVRVLSAKVPIEGVSRPPPTRDVPHHAASASDTVGTGPRAWCTPAPWHRSGRCCANPSADLSHGPPRVAAGKDARDQDGRTPQ